MTAWADKNLYERMIKIHKDKNGEYEVRSIIKWKQLVLFDPYDAMILRNLLDKLALLQLHAVLAEDKVTYKSNDIKRFDRGLITIPFLYKTEFWCWHWIEPEKCYVTEFKLVA